MMDVVEVKPSDLMDQYIALRDEKSDKKKAFDEACKAAYDEPMDAIEAQLLNAMNKNGVDSFSSETATAFKKMAVSVTTQDMAAFRNFIIAGEDWELCDWKPNKTMMNQLVEEGKPTPPGVNYTQTLIVQIRRKS
jgi:hypothetical protein